MKIIPETTLKEILNLNSDLRLFFENLGLEVNSHLNASMVEISQIRIIPLKILMEDINSIMNLSKVSN
jgi:hypothetical protein